MPAGPEKFVLRSTLTSPFGRKVRMAIELLGLGDRITLVPANPLDEKDTLRQQNPLGKMPCLVLSDGTSIYDSGVIIDYLQEFKGTGELIPPIRSTRKTRSAAWRASRRSLWRGSPTASWTPRF